MEGEVAYAENLELFLVEGKLVASQRLYSFAYMKDQYREVRHFYCGTCGSEWGQRIPAGVSNPKHYFYRKSCREHGGDQSMLNPWEWRHLDVLGPNVLAYLILNLSQEDKT